MARCSPGVMFTDQEIRQKFDTIVNGFKFEDGMINPQISILNPAHPYIVPYQDALNIPNTFSNPTLASNGASSGASSGDDIHEITDFNSDMMLSYISDILMEEDLDGKFYVHEGDDSALQAAEKSFSDLLTDSLPHQSPIYSQSFKTPDDSGNGIIDSTGTSFSGFDEASSSRFSIDYNSQSLSDSFRPDLFFANDPVWQFNQGVEESSMLSFNKKRFSKNNFSSKNTMVNIKSERGRSIVEDTGMRGRKHPHRGDQDFENERSCKHTAVSLDDNSIPPVMFDRVLLCPGGDKCNEAAKQLKKAKENEMSKNMENNVGKGPRGGKTKGRKQTKKEVVDLRTLLIQCAQSVATDDRRSVGDLLKQIRQHSSPEGDGTQRLAHYFANGLEARFAGAGSQTFQSFMETGMSVATILKSLQLHMAASPFKKMTFNFANKAILKAAENATRLHIIDYGIGFGFQWPCFMQRLSERHGGAPMLRITGIDKPLPGFRPAERIEETGRRLEGYAQRFNIPFEYCSIACKLEDVRIEELEINKGEVLVVNCMFVLKTLLDETVMVDSPRDIVLRKIKQMNPNIFIHSIINGSYSAPFFVTRFREALFHFSALFDMFESTFPREQPERLCIEKELFGREALNVIACEGIERMQRPETYKQWTVRTRRAGFTQLPLDQESLKGIKKQVRSCYNKDFVIDDDGKWLLQGWKGRIMYGASLWKPADYIGS